MTLQRNFNDDSQQNYIAQNVYHYSQAFGVGKIMMPVNLGFSPERSTEHESEKISSSQSSLGNFNRQSALKILKFMKFARKVSLAFQEKLSKIVLEKIIMIQRLARRLSRKILRRKGWVFASLIIEASNFEFSVEKVHVFGEFTKNPWTDKLLCQ